MLDRAFHSAGKVMPMHHMDMTDEPVDLQGDHIVFEDVWSVRLYKEVMQAAQIHIPD
jgi:hypothetical protein